MTKTGTWINTGGTGSDEYDSGTSDQRQSSSGDKRPKLDRIPTGGLENRPISVEVHVGQTESSGNQKTLRGQRPISVQNQSVDSARRTISVTETIEEQARTNFSRAKSTSDGANQGEIRYQGARDSGFQNIKNSGYQGSRENKHQTGRDSGYPSDRETGYQGVYGYQYNQTELYESSQDNRTPHGQEMRRDRTYASSWGGGSLPGSSGYSPTFAEGSSPLEGGSSPGLMSQDGCSSQMGQTNLSICSDPVIRNDSLSSDQSENVRPPAPRPHKARGGRRTRQNSMSSSDDDMHSTPDCTSCEDEVCSDRGKLNTLIFCSLVNTFKFN